MRNRDHPLDLLIIVFITKRFQCTLREDPTTRFSSLLSLVVVITFPNVQCLLRVDPTAIRHSCTPSTTPDKTRLTMRWLAQLHEIDMLRHDDGTMDVNDNDDKDVCGEALPWLDSKC
jgi:hypothetical protein